MLGGNKVNPVLPLLADDHQCQYGSNASNQLQLFGSVQSLRGVNPVNYVLEDNIVPVLRMNKLECDVDKTPGQQKLQISQNHGTFCDKYGLTAAIRGPDPVSTGLRLSYNDNKHNSSVSSASGSMTATQSIILSLDKSIGTELDHQNEEFDQYVKVQVEYLMKGIRDITERHMVSFLSAVERGVNKKLLEKDMEIENLSRRNQELGERVKQITMEVQSWQYHAKYNESVANLLKAKLQQAMLMGAGQGKERIGESEVDAASCIDLKNKHPGSNHGTKEGMVCKACKLNEVSVLLIPCRHLCLCKGCNGLVTLCPVCRLMATDRVAVNLS